MSNHCCCVLYSVQEGRFVVNKPARERLGSPPPPPPRREFKGSRAAERIPVILSSGRPCVLIARVYCFGFFICISWCPCIAQLSFENQSSAESGIISGAHLLFQSGAVWFLPKLFLFQFSWLQSKTWPLFFQCPDSACKQDLLAYLQRIALYCHQLNICSKVKAEVQNLGGELVVSGVCMSYDKSTSCGFSSRGNSYSKLSFYFKQYRI